MSEISNYQFQAGGSTSTVDMRRRRSLVVVIAALVTVIVAVVYFFGRTVTKPAQQTAANPAPASAAAQRSLGSGAEAITLPPLDQSDALVRRLAGALSSHPKVVAWLATSDLIRNFVVVVENTSIGASPAKHLRVLRPAQTFRVVTSGGEIAMDPRSYDRYTVLADAVGSVDAAASAQLYTMLKPRIEDAYGELGRPESFDAAVERAIDTLLEVPVLSGNARLESAVRGIGYRYADRSLEALNPAQKQLLRTGPRNTMVIQAKLREIALALGIPAARLPSH